MLWAKGVLLECLAQIPHKPTEGILAESLNPRPEPKLQNPKPHPSQACPTNARSTGDTLQAVHRRCDWAWSSGSSMQCHEVTFSGLGCMRLLEGFTGFLLVCLRDQGIS